MKKTIKIPRILKINSVKGFNVSCIFNNGETRIIDFEKLFADWKISKKDPEYPLLNEKEFKKVSLNNQTLSWKNINIELLDFENKKTLHPFEIDPYVLYKNSVLSNSNKNRFHFGTIIKDSREQKGLTQQDLADLSGTSKTYISRVENDKIEPELSTLYKIVEVGLGKKIKLEIV